MFTFPIFDLIARTLGLNVIWLGSLIQKYPVLFRDFPEYDRSNKATSTLFLHAIITCYHLQQTYYFPTLLCTATESPSVCRWEKHFFHYQLAVWWQYGSGYIKFSIT